MNQAQGQLGQGKPEGASSSMQQAAQSLQQAAQQLAQQPGQPGQAKDGVTAGREGSKGGGVPDASLLPGDMKKYTGKRWGELPGELRTQIIQDMKAKYGVSPTATLAGWGVLDGRTLMAHGVWLSADDIALLRSHSTGIARPERSPPGWASQPDRHRPGLSRHSRPGNSWADWRGGKLA